MVRAPALGARVRGGGPGAALPHRGTGGRAGPLTASTNGGVRHPSRPFRVGERGSNALCVITSVTSWRLGRLRQPPYYVSLRTIGEHFGTGGPRGCNGRPVTAPPVRRTPRPTGRTSGPGCDVLVVGCGNPMRGDDGVGPALVRHLWARGVPDGARLVDGGTAGTDLAFRMREADRVVIVDAGAVGTTPGTVYRVPTAMLDDLPPLQGLHTRSFRWDHAVAFARWALADACPDDITVFLVEAENVAMGADLSPSVVTAVDEVVTIVERDYLAPLRDGVGR
ncbi:MAG TPA: hydrogenase maturation protease [Umezawaea sp.]|nr:hydrogenase maturation protease [Umezawaea sp.]